LKHISINKTNCSSLNSSLILGIGVTVALTGGFWSQQQAEATVSNTLSSPVVNRNLINRNLNLTSNQNGNPVFVPVSTQSVEPTNNLPIQNQVAIKLEPLVNTENNSNINVPVVLAPVDKIVYKVQPGDTLDKIASKYDSSRQKLIQENQIVNPNLIKVHQDLKIPNEQNQQVTEEKSIFSVESSSNRVEQEIQQQSSLYIEKLKADVNKLRQEYKPNAVEVAQNTAIPMAEYDDELVTDSRIRQTNTLQVKVEDLTESQVKPVTQKTSNNSDIVATIHTPAERLNPFLQTGIGETVSPNLPPLGNPDQYLPNTPRFNGYIWPARGVFTSGYGWRWGRMHRGIDIAGPVGTPIFAAAEGEVVTAGWNSGGYGNLVKLRHPDGSLTLYAHNQRLLVRNGQKVEQGQRIAEMGSTGRSTGPHLHFEIHPNGKGAINPIALLPKKRP
jgi:murein DD-endopeptidase MepM/ murein hydrolase activator NlpD